MEAGPNVDIVLKNPYQWSEIETDSFDIVISGQALEHIEFFWVTMSEMTRVLKKDGLLCVIAPNGFAEHRYPVDCYRFFSDGMIALARYVNLQILHAHTNCAPTEQDTDWYSEKNADSMLIARKPYAGKTDYVNLSTYKCIPVNQEQFRDGLIPYKKATTKKNHQSNTILENRNVIIDDTAAKGMENNLGMSLSSVLQTIQDRIMNKTSYFGIKALQSPNDFWVYQEIIYKTKPDVLIEIGNFCGGSTLALAHILDALGHGRIIGLDINQSKIPDLVINHSRITLIEGDACKLYSQVKSMISSEERVLIIEDSSHTYENTLSVLRLYSGFIKPNDYFIVEDSICHHGLALGPSPGPYEAIETFIKENTDFYIDRECESFLITWNPKGYLKRKPSNNASVSYTKNKPLISAQNNQGAPDWLLNFISAQPTDKATCQTFLTAFNSYSLLEADKMKQLLESNSQLRQYIQYCLQNCDSQTREITRKINLFTPSHSSTSVVSTPDSQMEQLPLIYPIEHSDVFEPRRSYKEFDTELEAAYSKKAHYFHDDIVNDNKLVSIIMPTYNRANCIMKAINSVIQQSYSNWELLIIDDGSTDNTLETIETLSDNRIKIHKSQHQGVSAARNKGLENAKGDIIFYLDSDNEWTQYFLEYMLIALMSSKVKCAYSGLVILDDDNNILGYRGDAFNWTKCLEANYVDMNVFCHHRHLYQELGGFDESLKRMVDWDVILRYAKAHLPVYVPFIGCKYLNSQTDLFRISVTQPKSYKNIVQAKHQS